MNRIFLGPVVHWAILIALGILIWFTGIERFHVTSFNPFILSLLLLTAAVIVVILRTSPPGKQVTRDPVEDERED